MAGETKPGPFLKQTKKKIVLIGEKHQSLILTSFTLSIQPHPSSEWRVDRAQLTFSLFRPPPILLLYTQTTKAYRPTISVCRQQPCGTTLSTWWACKAQVCLRTSFHRITLIELPVRLAWLLRAFATHLLKWPLSHSWLTIFHKGGDGRLKAREKSQHTKPTIQNVKYFIFLKSCCPHYLQTKVLQAGSLCISAPA